MSVEQLINSQLLQDIQSHQGQGLWLLDEHDQTIPHSQPAGLRLVTNRYDVYQRFAAAGWEVSYSDWDFEALETASFDVIYYRISKEKAMVNHLIQSAQQLLKTDGVLNLYGAKSEGLKGYFDRIKKAGASAQLNKIGKGAMFASCSQLSHLDKNFSELDYQAMQAIAELSDKPVLSKPGVFGWQKIDAGSQFLADNWGQFEAIFAVKTVLDLGCGYGFLSLRYWLDLSKQKQSEQKQSEQKLSDQKQPEQKQSQQSSVSITATDSNAGAVKCCQQNFATRHITGEVIAADCGDQVDQQFDLILCNPPFHQGFGVEGELTDRFLASAQQHLNKDGQALFVVNGFVPLARKAEVYFTEIDVFADNGSFKLVRLAKPKKGSV